MWRLYLQYYLWRCLPRWFKQPTVLRAYEKVVSKARVASKTYAAIFDTEPECRGYLRLLIEAGQIIAYHPYVKKVEALVGPEIYEFEIEFTVMGDEANTRMRSFFDQAKYITVLSTDVQDALVTQNAELVPWQPGMKG